MVHLQKQLYFIQTALSCQFRARVLEDLRKGPLRKNKNKLTLKREAITITSQNIKTPVSKITLQSQIPNLQKFTSPKPTLFHPNSIVVWNESPDEVQSFGKTCYRSF